MGFNLFVFEVRLETKHEIHLSFLKQFQQFLYRPADDVKSNSRVLPGEVLAGIFSSCSPKTEGVQLHFDENGEFKILQLTDLHYVYKDFRSDIMFERMEELLDFEKPDLVRTIPGNLFPEYRAELPRVGFFGEPVCDPQLNSGLFNAMLECGDVMGVFCGHDHNNDYAINNRGILLAYGRYSGGDTVYNDIPNGGRVIVLKEGSRHFTTWVTLKGGERIDYLEY